MKRDIPVPMVLLAIAVALLVAGGLWWGMSARASGVYVDTKGDPKEVGGPGWRKEPRERGNR